MLSTGRPQSNLPKGFTLLELLIVMAIVGMMVALVIPRIGSGQATFLKAQVREAIAILNYARRSAIVEGTAKTATFYKNQTNDERKSNQKRQPGHWVSRGTDLQWGSSKQQEEVEITHTITFYPEGGSSGGEFFLSYQGHKAKITVSALTGKIESEGFTGAND
jgi:general secretion pathway protein H